MNRKQAEKIIDGVVEILTKVRKDKNLSHETVDNLAGVHRSTVSLIESRKREATLLTLLRIADALECDLGKIISKEIKK